MSRFHTIFLVIYLSFSICCVAESPAEELEGEDEPDDKIWVKKTHRSSTTNCDATFDNCEQTKNKPEKPIKENEDEEDPDKNSELDEVDSSDKKNTEINVEVNEKQKIKDGGHDEKSSNKKHTSDLEMAYFRETHQHANSQPAKINQVDDSSSENGGDKSKLLDHLRDAVVQALKSKVTAENDAEEKKEDDTEDVDDDDVKKTERRSIDQKPKSSPVRMKRAATTPALAVKEHLQYDYVQYFSKSENAVPWTEPEVTSDCVVQAMLTSKYPFSPSCTFDGQFAPKQCYLQRCWCVYKTGSPQVTDVNSRYHFGTAGVKLRCSAV